MRISAGLEHDLCLCPACNRNFRGRLRHAQLHAVDKVVTYQLAIYAATPVAFLINRFLLAALVSTTFTQLRCCLSGIAMMLMMYSPVITLSGVAISGFMMGLATGFFWANRGFLALSTTNDSNRNYYYGLESFFLTFTSVIVPMELVCS